MPGLQELIDQRIEAGESDGEVIADQILDALDPDAMRELVRPVFRWNVKVRLRKLTRIKEAKAFSSTRLKGSPVKAVLTSPAALKALLSDTFPLPDGRRVTWGEATVDDHEERAAMLLDHIATVEVTVARHEAAIALIQDAGVSCLAEIDEPKTRRVKKAA